MGTWGAGLYSDDDASDLKSTIGVLAKMPKNGDEILKILKENYDGTFDVSEEGGPLFWLVVADQFNKKNIACSEVNETAKMVIEKELDIRDCMARGAETGFLIERRKVLSNLLEKLNTQGPISTRNISFKKPQMPVHLGDVFAFPTMDGGGCNPWFSKNMINSRFRPNGWGAVVIVSTGYVFEWFPWCAYASLKVEPDNIPTIEDTSRSRFLDKDGAEICVPRQNHMKKIQMEYIGQLPIDPEKGKSTIRKGRKPIHAVMADWSFYGYNDKTNNGFLPIKKLFK